jgi:hypothetical protein
MFYVQQNTLFYVWKLIKFYYYKTVNLFILFEYLQIIISFNFTNKMNSKNVYIQILEFLFTD